MLRKPETMFLVKTWMLETDKKPDFLIGIFVDAYKKTLTSILKLENESVQDQLLYFCIKTCRFIKTPRLEY